MATRPATAPDAAPRWWVAVAQLLDERASRARAAAVATWVLVKASAAVWFAAEGGAGVEAEPAEPQQAGAEQHERQVVRLHRRLGPADALAEHERQREARGTGVDVDRGTTGEVHDALVGEPAGVAVAELGATEVEHPVRDREVDDRDPEATKMPQPRNFARSAMAPEISAGVMMANISWNIANARAGIG